MNDKLDVPAADTRLSSGTFNSEYMTLEKLDDEADDPISAYFKTRCRNSQLYSKKRESDSDSSVGIIDVDNVSLFDKDEDIESLRLSQNLVEQFKNSSAAEKKKVSLANRMSDIEKQRVLAQEALKKLRKEMENPSDFPPTPEPSRESSALNDISSKVNNTKPQLAIGSEISNSWFKPNLSMGTPIQFKDELNSITEDSFPNKTEPEQKRQSQYSKQVNKILKDLSQVHLNADIEFESYSKEEKINRLEEDEKKFKLENAGVLHNSGISQFSGIIEEEAFTWPSDLPKQHQENKNFSIGEFFNKRSNSINSLIGSVGNENHNPSWEPSNELSKLSVPEPQKLHDFSLPICEASNLGKKNLRRCASSCDLKRASDIPKSGRISNDSVTSNSTVMIQNILAEMESGLSGTQIYEKLIKSYNKKKIPEAKSLEKIVENSETPKSSKVPVRKEIREGRKENFERDLNKTIKSPSNVKTKLKPKFLSNDDYKENDMSEIKESVIPERNVKLKQLKGRKGFDASTPKLQVLKSQNNKFKTSCSKVLINSEDWEAPRISSIQPTFELSKSGFSDENEKTITANLTLNFADPVKKTGDVETYTIEDTIVAGDLSVLSQRIKEMKDEGVCIVRTSETEEPVLLTVIQKLATLPKGSTDCTALIALLQEQFPELLSTFSSPVKKELAFNIATHSNSDRKTDICVAEPGSWIKLPMYMGLTDKIYACAEVEQIIEVPLTNISKNWLLISIESINLIHPSGRRLPAVKKNNNWNIFDFVTISMKETLIPPECQQSLKIFFTPKIPTTIEMNVVFTLKQLLKKDFQSKSLRIKTHNVNPMHSINVIPKDSINFGIIGDQCSDSSIVQVSFDGICHLPLIVYLEEEDSQSQHFFIKPCINVNSKNGETEWIGKKFNYNFQAGEKQLLEFRICFEPNTLLEDESATQEFRALLIFKLATKTESDGILQKIPVKGSVGCAKFYCAPSCTPLVFRASEKGQPVTKSFLMKNVGSLPIAFSVKIFNEDYSEPDDNLFVAPKTFYLSRNEESSINITFNANTSENYIKRLLWLKMTPNGRASYEADLIGIISSESRPVSRISGDSASTNSTNNVISKPVRLLTTTQCLSWPAVPLEKETTLSFQLKNGSGSTMWARIFFMKNLDSFKFVHENGEKVQKLRKQLKPDCPCTVTVVFRPDSVGTHHNVAYVEMNQNTKKAIALYGIGGMPNIFLANVKSDLNGCKILRLQNCLSNNQFFFNTLEFKNEGRIPGFITIEPSMEVLSICRELTVVPSSLVIAPNSTASVKVTQRLKNEDLKFLLSDKDISKIATLSVIIGDEPSRLRLRKLVKNGIIPEHERNKSFIGTYHNEMDINLKIFEDSARFELQFFKSLKMVEVPVVVERSPGTCEPSILEDADETVQEFFTILSANNTIVSTSSPPKEFESCSSHQKTNSNDGDSTLLSKESLSSRNRIAQWLETLECP